MNFGMSSGQFQPQDRRMVDWQTGIRGLSVVLGVPSAPLPCLRHRRKFITRSRVETVRVSILEDNLVTQIGVGVVQELSGQHLGLSLAGIDSVVPVVLEGVPPIARGDQAVVVQEVVAGERGALPHGTVAIVLADEEYADFVG